ncbi:hypothetical protein G9A89_001278 [Geosiphon pyriformis]|nr:hypothetical protein G9A89_001278 [Geosiphon pyriformis]
MLTKVWRVTHGDDWIPNFPIEGSDRSRKETTEKHKADPRILYKHFQKEFWIEPPCDCVDPKIYLCYHTTTLYENEDCNARNHYHNALYPAKNWQEAIEHYRASHSDDEHLGPNFDHVMFKEEEISRNND